MPALEATAIREAGVVGAGGAGFPTYVKLNGSADILLANGAECEPLLRADQGLMQHRAGDVVRGLDIASDLVGAEQRQIGAKAKYRAWAPSLRDPGASCVPLPDFYPIGDEHLLVYEVTGRVVPQGGLPIDVGVVTQNIETLVNVARVAAGEPVVDTYLSVLGEVAEGREMRVPVGTSVGDVIAWAGGATAESHAIIDGGPMMGYLVDPDAPVTKTTKALIVLPSDHPLIEMKRSADVPGPRALRITQSSCCQCHICTDLCPRFLLGHDIFPDRAVGNLHLGRGDDVVLASSVLCTQCNLCAYFACPLRLYPSEIHASVKRTMRDLKTQPYKVDQRATTPMPYRDWRRVPSKRLIQRLWLERYQRPLRWDDTEYSPEEVHIRLLQHIGAPARAAVTLGDRVERGDCIARVEGDQLGVSLHASIGGRVAAVDASQVTIRA